ncbi:Eco57I restriction-modification methylase domain-containing protein [Cellulomonas composti]|uniref:Eco57I restriction-modification methylase domain-containing protein n=1 Tax=Cellulomonas composti TaxID=266130 RepID=UPI0011BDC386|nr:hypothetical protein [Cellulomonas composti]
MSSSDSFLADFRRRTWDLTDVVVPDGLTPLGYYGTASSTKLEVAVARADHKPNQPEARALWRARQRGRATGVLLVILYPATDGWHATVVGLRDDAVGPDAELSVVERRVAQALDAEAEREATELLESLFTTRDEAVPGLVNKGLFASHALEVNVPQRADWAQAAAAGAGVGSARGEDMLKALGWSIQVAGADLLLRPAGRDRERAVAVLLEGEEVFDRPTLRYGLGTSPVEHGIEVARAREVPWVLVVRGSVVRLYASDPDKGVTRTGAASYTQLDLGALSGEHLAYAGLLLTPSALEADGTADQILKDSREHATSLGERLRDRVYKDVVPKLAETIASRLGSLTEQGLNDAYHHTLVVLFRLLFVAYAEDRTLLPYGTNTVYTRDALKTRARTWADDVRDNPKPHFDEHATDIWDDLQAIWKAVYGGHTEWGVPEYGGSLFRDDSPSGQAIARLRLTNAEIGPALVAMLVDTGRDGTYGPVDFQALSVREFGTIYEGLLESSLSLAPVDLAVDPKTLAYVPAKPGDDVVAHAGSVYFHNASGARKATGSYFTKEFAVEHLLETALDPTVAEHLARVAELVASGRESDAAEALFDFRVADIAMGSGHFLVAAVDHVARAMNGFLDSNPMPAVTDELDRLRSAAIAKLADVGVTGAAAPEITHEALLRRQVARRCIYGVDVNEIAVELARLALWIQTFVPGLPMSSLDHGLVHGNSLTGIGTIEEALDELEPDRRTGSGIQSLFADEVLTAIAATDEPLKRAARISEVSVAETLQAEALQQEAREKVAPVASVFDAIVGARLGLLDLRLLSATGWSALEAAGARPAIRLEIDRLRPVHFPIAFPEAFRPGRERPGFDVILGNPPWEKVKVEEHGWWGLRFPGLRSMSQKDKNAAIPRYRRERPDLLVEYEADVAAAEALRDLLKAGPYDLGSGDTDLYKVFCWRDWALLREFGRAGVVFPRGALSGSGTASWRSDVLRRGAFDDVCFVTNSRQWVFDEVHPQYTVGLTTLRRGGSNEVRFNGPFHSLAEFEAGHRDSLTVAGDEFAGWSAGAAFPLLPTNAAAGVFRTMRSHPRFDARDGFEFRPVRELDATGDKSRLDFDLARTDGRTPVLAGASFNLWDPDFGEPYATADAGELERHLLKKRERQFRTSSSAFYGLDPTDELPLHRARIAFRDVARSTDSRTVLVALLPPEVSFTHKAPYLLRRVGESRHEALVLGVLSSLVLDWYARRYVEITLSFEILNTFPVPRPGSDDPRARRVIELAGRLAAVDGRFESWAAEVGVPIGSANEPSLKDDLVAELDAVVAHLYGLSREDLTLIFETFHRGWDYAPRLAAVLVHFDRWTERLAVEGAR